MKKSTVLLLLILSIPAVSQTWDKWYAFGGIGGYSTNAVDTYAIWHVGGGIQFNKRWGFELDLWPGLSGAEPRVDEVELFHTSLSFTFRARQIYRSPDVHIIFKGGSTRIRSTNHDEVGASDVNKGPGIVGIGLVVNPQSKRSLEFSVSRVLDVYEHSDTFKATMRFRF